MAMSSPALSENFLTDVSSELDQAVEKLGGDVAEVESVAESLADSAVSTSAGSAGSADTPGKFKVLDGGRVHEKNDYLLSQALAQAGKAMCYQCGTECDIARTIVKVKTTAGNCDKFACRRCNALTVMLCRNMAWPPPFFSELDPVSQKQFFKNCHETAADNGRFTYSKVRCTLVKSLSNSKKTEYSAESFSEPHPLKFWLDQGYEEEKILANATKVEHACGTLYQFAVTRTSQKVTIQQVEEHVQKCEQKVTANKKRALEDGEDSSDSDLSAGSSSSSKGKSGKKGKKGKKDKSKKMAARAKAAKKKAADDLKKEKAEKDKADKAAKKAADKAASSEAARIKKHNAAQASLVRKVVAMLKGPHDTLVMADLIVSSPDHANKIPHCLREQLSDVKRNLAPMMNEATTNNRDVDQCVKNKTEAPTLSFTLETAQAEVKSAVDVLKSFKQLSSTMGLPALS